MGENWKEIKFLGAGTFGVVTLWACASTGESVALKRFRVPSQRLRQFSFVAKFKLLCQDEVDRMEGINHPNVVATVPISERLKTKLREKDTDSTCDFIEYPDPDLPYLCMEYCSRGDLRQLLRRPENLSGLQQREILAVLSNITDALLYLHNEKKILHRDIKPENILIQWDPALERSVYKLGDFGLAKDVSSLESLCSTFAGTHEYLAPEVRNRLKYDRTVDFWSFGLIAFEICCGSLPFAPADLPITVNPHRFPLFNKIKCEIPLRTHLAEPYRRSLSNWLPSMLQYDPANRGRYRIVTEDKEVTTCSLAWLRNFLDATFLHVHTPLAGWLVYQVFTSTTILEVQNWIYKETKTAIEDQLILAEDGAEISSDKMAAAYAKDKIRMFMIPKSGELCTQVVFPKGLCSFMIEPSETTFDSRSLQQLWISDIFHVQTQLKSTEDLLKAEVVLRNKHFKSGFAFVPKEDKERMQELYTLFRELWASFNAFVRMNEMLEGVDVNFASKNFADPSFLDIKTTAQDLYAQAETYFQEFFLYCKDNVRPKSLSCYRLNELFERLLELYEIWNSASSRGAYTLNNLQEVRQTISLFLTTEKDVLSAAGSNMRLLIQRTLPQHEKERKILDVFAKLQSFQNYILKQRQEKQHIIWKFHLPEPETGPRIPTPRVQSCSHVGFTVDNRNDGSNAKKSSSGILSSLKSVFDSKRPHGTSTPTPGVSRFNDPVNMDLSQNPCTPNRNDDGWVVVFQE